MAETAKKEDVVALGLREAMEVCSSKTGTLWYVDNGKPVCECVISADETGVSFIYGVTRSLRHVFSTEEKASVEAVSTDY